MTDKPFKVSDVFPGFIEAEDLPEGKDIPITIERVRMAGSDDKGKDGRQLDKPIIKIKGKSKEWVICKTVARAIRRQHGDDMNNWPGNQISIYRTTCNAFGNPNTPCIRVRGEKL